MEQERRSIRIGLAVIGAALLLRAFSGGFFQPVISFFSRQSVASFLIFLETGRTLHTPTVTQPTEPDATEAVYDTVFSAEDADLVQVSTLNAYSVDIPAMLLSPLEWDLTTPEPAVLILHSHATESYTQTAAEAYTESSAYRTLDSDHNMLRVGAQLKQQLEAAGIGVIHDTTLHDHPDYNASYAASRETAQKYLEEYPSIRIVLDIHRDAAELSNATQLRTDAVVDGQESAQLMFVIGTDGTGLYHPDWERNMALAVKLHALLEKRWPGLCRPINFRAQRFNQDLSPGAMIVEVGAAGDTLEEALVAARALAQGIIAISGGAKTNSTS